MSRPDDPSLGNIITELEHEIVMRERVYPGLIVRRKMTRGQADFKIECIKKAIRVVKWVQQKKEGKNGTEI